MGLFLCLLLILKQILNSYRPLESLSDLGKSLLLQSI